MKKIAPGAKMNKDGIKLKKQKKRSSTSKPSGVSKGITESYTIMVPLQDDGSNIADNMGKRYGLHTTRDQYDALKRAPQSLSKFAIIDELNSEKKSNIIIEELIGLTGLSSKTIAENIFEISLKTLHNYKKSAKSLPTKLFEQSIKIEGLFNKGKEIFGSDEKFRTWMNMQSYGLNNKVPLVLLNSVTGIDLVYEELIRMEFGTPV